MKHSILRSAIALAVSISSAHAADADQKTDPMDSLEEIVVTTTKRAESVRDIPLSMDVFTGDDLDRRGLDTLAEILRYSPGVYMQPGNTPDSNQINIRGGSSSTGDFNRPFGIFYGEVPLINPTFVGTQPEIDPFDMATVEVLKGPQGTLFGGSALLGAIRYVPNKPVLGETYGSVSVGGGTTEGSDDLSQQMTGVFNYGSDRFAMRVAGSVRDYAGVIDDTFTGENDVDSIKLTHWRAIATWQILEPLAVTFSFQDRDMRADANVATTIDNDQGVQVNGRRRGGPDGSNSNQQIAGVSLDWQATDELDVSFNASRLVKDGHLYSSAFVANLFGVDVVNPFEKFDDTEQYTYELRAVHATPTQSSVRLLRDWEYVAGLYFMRSDQLMNLQTLFDFSGAPPTGFPTNLMTGRVRAAAVAEELAFYFDATRKLSQNWDLTLGGRVFEQRTPLSLGLSLVGPLAGAPVDPEFVRTEELKETGFNPKAAISWRATEQISTFLSAAKGYRFGGVNLNLYNSPLVPSLFESDMVWNYELGARTTWLDGRLQFDLTAFYIDWRDRQSSERTPTDPSVEYIANTGTWEIKGAEFALRTKLTHGLTWSINGAYVNSISKDPYINGNGVLVPPGTPETSTPKVNASTLVAYAGGFGDWKIDSALGYSYRSAADSPLNNVPLDAYGSVDAMFAIGNSRWPMSPTLSLDVINLTNSDALVAGEATGPQGTVGRTIAAKTFRPRTVMLNVKFAIGSK